MAIEEEKQEVEDNTLAGELPARLFENVNFCVDFTRVFMSVFKKYGVGIESEFLLDLQRSDDEFCGWLEGIRSRRKRSLSVLDEVRGDLERSQSWLESIYVDRGANNSFE
jgi:hypothetical protein